MSAVFGKEVCFTIAGESHGKGITGILSGMPAGIKIDEDFIVHQMNKRKAIGNTVTQRHESDRVEILSGVFNGYTTGSPITFFVANEDTQSKDYSLMQSVARPSHADYSAECKYKGFQDYRGGGHFSGRLSAVMVAAGAVSMYALNQKGIYIGTHILKCAGISDRNFGDYYCDIEKLDKNYFAVLDDESKEKMLSEITRAKDELDSVGGILESCVVGLPAGIGEPFFDSVESVLSHILFSIPGIKGVEFGRGFEFSDLRGSEANDEFCIKNKKVSTTTNNSGGINGGITNGEAVIVRCAVKPTPSIGKEQNTVDFKNMSERKLTITGRHDPAIVVRARAVVDSAIAIALCDLMVRGGFLK